QHTDGIVTEKRRTIHGDCDVEAAAGIDRATGVVKFDRPRVGWRSGKRQRAITLIIDLDRLRRSTSGEAQSGGVNINFRSNSNGRRDRDAYHSVRCFNLDLGRIVAWRDIDGSGKYTQSGGGTRRKSAGFWSDGQPANARRCVPDRRVSA